MCYPLDAEPATYGLEGLANLRNTMFNNDLQWVNLGVCQNRGGRGVRWSSILSGWYRQAFVGKTDKFKHPFITKILLIKLVKFFFRVINRSCQLR